MSRRIIVVVALLACATLAGAEDYERWVPVAASNEGLHGSYWTTDLSIFNRARDQATWIHVAFFPDAEGTEEPEEVTLLIEEPTAMLEIHDVVAELFGESRPGALRLRSNHPFEASSRTFNIGGADGSHGEGIPAVEPDDFGRGWVLMSATNIPGPDGMRSNLGLVSSKPSEEEVHLWLTIQDTGELFGPSVVELGPYGWRQLDVFALFGLADSRVDSAKVEVFCFGRRLFPYLSLVDTRSGDGSFILPVSGETELTIPREWEVSITLTHAEGVESYAITYASGSGGYAVVPDPGSGWTVEDLRFISPTTFCYSVVAVAGEGGGDIEVEVLRTPEGGSAASQRSGYGRSDAGPVSVEGCLVLD